MTELTYGSLARMTGALRSGQISALELTELHLARIQQINPTLNAVCYLAEAEARAQARRADEERHQGRECGPLHGIPFTVKDWIEVAGAPCLAGDRRYEGHIPIHDATAVARLRAAGGIFLGKTGVGADSEVYGRIYNPYGSLLSPAGSSSGEAALIASGGSPLGLGSDSGGSIRQPAHNCGIAGLKPTSGRVPLTGHLPRISPMADPRTVIGPLARYVEDLALALPIIAGVDWRDPSVVPAPLGDFRQVQLNGLRGVFYAHHGGADPTPECVEALQKAVRTLEAVGVRLEEKVPPRITEAQAITRDYWSRPESASLENWEPYDPSPLTGDQVERHLFEWDRFRHSLIAFMERIDFILTPVAERPARPHGEEGGIPYTLPYSLVGYPCSVVRVASTAEGLPVGVQVVARPWREDVALAVAYALEQATGGWQSPRFPVYYPAPTPSLLE